MLKDGLDRNLNLPAGNSTLVFAAMALLFVAVALIASYLPARRALDMDPLVAIRE